jgi:gentisate 1,2-dioxygenase
MRSAVQNLLVLKTERRHTYFVTNNKSPVRLTAVNEPGQPLVSPELEELYRGFEKEMLVPLWTEISGLMPQHPQSKAQPHLWRWNDILPLAERSGELVPVGRGGERREPDLLSLKGLNTEHRDQSQPMS